MKIKTLKEQKDKKNEELIKLQKKHDDLNKKLYVKNRLKKKDQNKEIKSCNEKNDKLNKKITGLKN